MKKRKACASIWMCLISLVALPFCAVLSAQSQVTVTERVVAEMLPSQGFLAETDFASFRISGSKSEQCIIKATHTIEAPAADQAEQFASSVKTSLSSDSSGLIMTIDRPDLPAGINMRSSFTITVPNKADIICRTSFGSVSVDGIRGNLDIRTSFEKLTVSGVKGNLQLENSNGDIICEQVTPYLVSAGTAFGDIDIECSDDAIPEPLMYITNFQGSIYLKSPYHFSGLVVFRANEGTAATTLSVKPIEPMAEDFINGRVRQGIGYLEITTAFGNIEVD